jgi:hypothetical protein
LWPFLGLLLATWAAVALSHRKLNGVALLRALAFTAMGLRSSRYIGLTALILAPLLIQHGAELLGPGGLRLAPRAPTRRNGDGARSRAAPVRAWPAVHWAILALALIAAGVKVAQPLDPETIRRVHRQIFPVRAAEVLWGDAQQAGTSETHAMSPELFNEYGWGGYLIWAGANAPAQAGAHARTHSDARWPVFIDGRADPYGDELIEAYRQIVTLRPGWEGILARYDVRTALLAADSALGAVMKESDGWQEVYADEVAAIWVHPDPW